MTRVLDAPGPRVFEAWTKAEQLAQWWGPEGFSVPACDSDFREGGTYRIVMRAPDGQDSIVSGVYRAIKEPESLDLGCDVEMDGRRLMTGFVQMKLGLHVGKTRLTVHAGAAEADAPADAALGGMEDGWIQSLDRLAAFLAKS